MQVCRVDVPSGRASTRARPACTSPQHAMRPGATSRCNPAASAVDSWHCIARARGCDEASATRMAHETPCSTVASTEPAPRWSPSSTAMTVAGLAALSSAMLIAPSATAAVAPVAGDVAALDAAQAASLEAVLRPVFAVYTLLYIVRIPMTWYPNINTKEMPWVMVAIPTDPFLAVARKVVPLVGGVDVTPIVLVAIISFANEILLGPQGILMLIQRQGSL